MDEEEFDPLIHSRGLQPFGSGDAIRLAAQAGRVTAAGIALWGRTSADLQRQLLAPRPEIPPGIELADLRGLQAWVEKILLIVERAAHPRSPQLLSMPGASCVISVGSRQFTEWHARLEIVRRAIEYLENR